MKRVLKICVIVLIVSFLMIVSTSLILGATNNNPDGLLQQIKNSGSGDAGEELALKIDNVYVLLAKRYLPLLGGILLVISFLFLQTGNPEAKKKVMWAMVGIAGITFTPAIIVTIMGL